jgi:hypothetical protein
LEWGVLKHKCIVVNVYSKCDLATKRKLWERLVLARRNLGRGAWCILGDFNTVGDMDERRGVHLAGSGTNNLEISLFNDFKREVDLVDQNVLGRHFTWYHANGVAMSRIDRVLILEEWNRWWGIRLCGYPRDVGGRLGLGA